jgi:hypothetical protein
MLANGDTSGTPKFVFRGEIRASAILRKSRSALTEILAPSAFNRR